MKTKEFLGLLGKCRLTLEGGGALGFVGKKEQLEVPVSTLFGPYWCAESKIHKIGTWPMFWIEDDIVKIELLP